MATGGCVPDAEVNKLTCAVCLEKYRRPKLLPCFHTFCQSCLQAVAGPSPSFPCPACRTPVLLPPGGVAALQTNFYIEQDLGTGSTPTVRLCDVCTEDREATHTCLQCQQRYCPPCRRVHDSITSSRSHTVVSLQPDGQDDGNLKGDSSMKEREEFCLKHRNQPVILHCTACKSNICMQCKLTSHEGHPTEDLSDTGEKVKAKLQDKLEMMVQQKRNIEGQLSAIDEKRRNLQSLHDSTEKEIRNRTETIHLRANDCQENALNTLQSLREQLMKTLKVTEERLLHKQAAISAQHDHTTRVLLEDKDTDIVSLEGQLKEVTLDHGEVSQLLSSLENDPFTCDHNPAAVNTSHLQEYVGVVRRTALKTTDISLVPRVPLSTPASVSSGTVSITEVVYCTNPKSELVAIDLTSEKRAWIKYKPSGEGEMMGLFNKEGLLLSTDSVIRGKRFVTVLNDITVGIGNCRGIPWIQIDGRTGQMNTEFHLTGVPKCGNQNMFATTNNLSTCYIEYQICLCSVTSGNPFKWTTSSLSSSYTPFAILDVSKNERYIAGLGKDKLDLYLNARSDVRSISSYIPEHKQNVLDACFFLVRNKEQLLVVVEGDNRCPLPGHGTPETGQAALFGHRSRESVMDWMSWGQGCPAGGLN